MRGGHSTLKEKNGNSLVHLAVQMGSIGMVYYAAVADDGPGLTHYLVG